MIKVPFDVNDHELRADFFRQHLLNAVGDLKEEMKPRWGTMSAQHMLEHLVWAFRCSTGALKLHCHTPESLLERTKRFLHDSRQTPRSFRNPELGDAPPPLEFAGLVDAQRALREEIECFHKHFSDYPKAVHTHPIFGSLDGEGWSRAHFKHCYHHLLQFDLIKEDDA